MLTLRSLFSTRQGIDADEQVETPAVPYVEKMLSSMIDRGAREMTLSPKSRQRQHDAANGSTLNYRNVHNRLKIMCGLNPFYCPEPMVGRFQFAAYGSMYEAECSFKDGNGVTAERCIVRVGRMSGASHAPAA